jgi:hypothetical protein
MIRGSPFPCITIFSLVFGAVFDKNSLWGELNIQKGELCVKGILAQDPGFVGGPFQRGFGVEVEGDAFNDLPRSGRLF